MHNLLKLKVNITPPALFDGSAALGSTTGIQTLQNHASAVKIMDLGSDVDDEDITRDFGDDWEEGCNSQGDSELFRERVCSQMCLVWHLPLCCVHSLLLPG